MLTARDALFIYFNLRLTPFFVALSTPPAPANEKHDRRRRLKFHQRVSLKVPFYHTICFAFIFTAAAASICLLCSVDCEPVRVRLASTPPDLTDESTADKLATRNARRERCVFPREGRETAATGNSIGMKYLSRVSLWTPHQECLQRKHRQRKACCCVAFPPTLSLHQQRRP